MDKDDYRKKPNRRNKQMKKMAGSHKGMNTPNTPKAGPSASGPKDTSDGVSLSTGYKTVSASGMSPRAVSCNNPK